MTARILIVGPDLARLLEAKLSAEHYQVASARDGVAALRQAQAWRPDLILLDSMTPGMDAYASCRKLKDDSLTQHIPVVMVATCTEPNERARGLESGADDVLTNVVEYGLLLARVRSHLRLKHLLDEWRVRGDTARSIGRSSEDAQEAVIMDARALVIDDWDAGAQNVQDMLARAAVVAGHAHNTAEALALTTGIAFHLIVVNLCMTEEDPLRLVASLRAAEATRDVPILLLAQSAEWEHLLRGIELGADDWLLLPLDENALHARARNQILCKFYQNQLRAGRDPAP